MNIVCKLFGHRWRPVEERQMASRSYICFIPCEEWICERCTMLTDRTLLLLTLKVCDDHGWAGQGKCPHDWDSVTYDRI